MSLLILAKVGARLYSTWHMFCWSDQPAWEGPGIQSVGPAGVWALRGHVWTAVQESSHLWGRPGGMLVPHPHPHALWCFSLASSMFPERKPPPTSPKEDASPAGSSASGKQVDQMAHSRGPALSGCPLHKGHFWTAKCFVLSMCPEKQGPNVLWFLQRGESESLLSWGSL